MSYIMDAEQSLFEMPIQLDSIAAWRQTLNKDMISPCWGMPLAGD